VIVQTTTTPGEILLTASAKNLRPATLRLTTTPATARPSLPPARVRYFVTGWRRSPVSAVRPDPNQQIAEQDMNSWERIAPGPGATHASGYAIYRATIKAPKVVQSRGGRLLFGSTAGDVEMYVDGKGIDPPAVVPLAPGNALQTLSLLVAGPGGLTGPVEIVAN
jgi:beta-galactosidase